MDDSRLIVIDQGKRQTLFGVAFGLLLAFAAFQLWQSWFGKSEGDPVAATLSTFEKANRLTVFTAQLSPVVVAEESQLMGMLKSKQVAVIPARVDYTLDLSQLKREAMAWDKDAQRLTVTLPPLTLSKANLDEGHAQYLREGVWIGREAQAKLTRDNTLLAERLATEQAGNATLMSLARDAAREAVRQNLAVPLQMAGFAKATIDVKFNGETSSR